MNEIIVYGNTLDDWTENEPDKDLSYGWTQVCVRLDEIKEYLTNKDYNEVRPFLQEVYDKLEDGVGDVIFSL